MPTTPYMVYFLADLRTGPYVIGVGGLRADVMREVKETTRRICAADDSYLPAFCLVWFERMPTHSGARARAAQIRRWPHRWQRRLIESVNPDWWERSQMETGFPREFWQAVPETLPPPKR
ncbi:hypothetical protein [Lysobacter sp. Root690]|uniref:hypothetical protein n=1 Tax=Lysobacter sp. Root690 TaxID=1736588 RepID=UPI0006F3E2E9|nr:hypothetical protein [Lysobacter sp. Root690]KRB07832.1 hypothetical protein ASD86_08430 [Lysobacter sp. Root690]